MKENHGSILIIDDCEDIRFLLSLKLRRLGYNVLVARDGHDAFEILNQCQDINLILIDLMMPKYTGIDFLTELKKDPTKRHIQVLCITASRDSNLLTNAKKVGVDGIIRKPIKDKTLRKEIEMHLPH